MELREKIEEISGLIENAKESLSTSINPKTGKLYITDQGRQEAYDEILEQTSNLLEALDHSFDEEGEEEALEEFLYWIIARKDAVLIEDAEGINVEMSAGIKKGVLEALSHLEDLLLEQEIEMPEED